MAMDLVPIRVGRYRALRRMVESGQHRLVVSFGGGAVPGIAGNLALARLLEQLELREAVEQVWGTSAGAIVAGGWASGASATEVLHEVLTLDRPGAIDVDWRRLAAAMMLRPLGRELPAGLVRGDAILASIQRGIRCMTIEDCPKPVRLIAVHDDGSMRRKIFRTGCLARSIFASMSIPGIIVPRPVEDGSDETFYDGGLLEKTPLLSPLAEHTRSGERRKLLLLGTHFETDAKSVPARSFLARFLQTIYALEDVAWRLQLDEVRKRDDVTLCLLNPKFERTALFEFDRVTERFAAAHALFAESLEDARLPLTFGAS
ncbi:MAG: patatin-like phospholipase family protein [Planctomycetota bacterium]